MYGFKFFGLVDVVKTDEAGEDLRMADLLPRPEHQRAHRVLFLIYVPRIPIVAITSTVRVRLAMLPHDILHGILQRPVVVLRRQWQHASSFAKKVVTDLIRIPQTLVAH